MFSWAQVWGLIVTQLLPGHPFFVRFLYPGRLRIIVVANLNFAQFFLFFLPLFTFSSLYLPLLVKVPRGGLEGFLAVPPGRPGPAAAMADGLPEGELTVPTFPMLEE
jgi:hypothetical protein